MAKARLRSSLLSLDSAREVLWDQNSHELGKAPGWPGRWVVTAPLQEGFTSVLWGSGGGGAGTQPPLLMTQKPVPKMSPGRQHSPATPALQMSSCQQASSPCRHVQQGHQPLPSAPNSGGRLLPAALPGPVFTGSWSSTGKGSPSIPSLLPRPTNMVKVPGP